MAASQEGKLWRSGRHERGRRGDWPYLSLGWSSEAWAEREDGNEDSASWLIRLARDASFDVLPPLYSWQGTPDSYAARMFVEKANGPVSSCQTTHTSRGEPIDMDSFDSMKLNVLEAMLRPAALLLDPQMARPLATLSSQDQLVRFWIGGDYQWTLETALQDALFRGVFATANAIHRATKSASEGRLEWSMTQGAPSAPPDFYLSLVSPGVPTRCILVVELNLFVRLQTAQAMLQRGRDKRAAYKFKPDMQTYVEEDALLAQPLRQAEAADADMACLWTGAMLVVLKRIGNGAWAIFDKTFCSMEFQAGVGEAGIPADDWVLSEDYVGTRTDDDTTAICNEYGALPLFIALAEYAKRVALDKPAGSSSPGSSSAASEVVVDGIDPPGSRSRFPPLLPSPLPKRTRSGKSYDLHPPSDAAIHSSFRVAKRPMSEGHNSALWRVWRAEGGESDSALLFKRFKSTQSGTQLTKEVCAYTQGRLIQGVYVPNLVSVVHPTSTLSLSSSTSSVTSLQDCSVSSSSSADSIGGIILSHMGESLLDLAGTIQRADPLSARARFAAAFLPRLASYFSLHGYCDAAGASEHVCDLVLQALRSLHGQAVLHGDVASRNICLRFDDKGSLMDSFIDLEDSTLLENSELLQNDVAQEQQAKRDAEYALAQEAVQQSVTRFWPRLKDDFPSLSLS